MYFRTHPTNLWPAQSRKDGNVEDWPVIVPGTDCRLNEQRFASAVREFFN
jgi:hypothetical protein